MKGYIKNPNTPLSEDLEQAAGDCMRIVEAVLATFGKSFSCNLETIVLSCSCNLKSIVSQLLG
jgi:hypothetical protein